MIHWLPNITCNDPCGIVCAGVGYCVIGYAVWAVNTHIVNPVDRSMVDYIHVFLFNGIAIMAVWSHVVAMMSDPGYVPKTFRADPALNMRECKRCHNSKPPTTHHCSTCKHCIYKMDHHCPWVNNCVGALNHKFFMLYCFYIMVMCTYAISLSVRRVITCMGEHWITCNFEAHPGLIAVYVMLIILGLLFGIFTAAMLGEQLCGINHGEGKIDRMKHKKENNDKSSRDSHNTDKETFLGECAVVFGEPVSIRWFIPIKPRMLTSIDFFLDEYRPYNENMV